MKWHPTASAIVGISILLFGLAIYWPGLGGGFFFDDSVNILEPEGVRLTNISTKSLQDAWESGVGGPLGRPVAMLTFATNYYFSGFDPFAIKLTNLLIHCLNAILVYILVRLLVKAAESEMPGARSIMLPLMVSALWFVHPIQLTSVLYAVQRMTSLAGSFVLLATILHVSFRLRLTDGFFGWLYLGVAWCVIFPVAVMTKESALLFPLYITAYELILQRYLKNKFDRFGKIFLSIILIAFISVIAYLLLPGAGLLQGYEIRNFTLEQRVLTEFRIVWTYIGQMLVPSLNKFALYHDDFRVSMGMLEPPGTLVAALGCVLLLGTSWIARDRFPLISFGLLWFMVGHVLESTIFPLELMHEHRNYLPSLGVFLVLGALIQMLWRFGDNLKVLAPLLFIAFFLYTGLITSFRSDMYGNDFRRTQIEASYHKDSVRTHYEAGALLVNLYSANSSQMFAEMAEAHFENVKKLDSNDKLALLGKLQLDCLSKKNSRVDVFEELRTRLSRGRFLAMDRSVLNAIAEMSNVGTLCLSRQQVDELFRVSLENPGANSDDRSVMRSDYVLYLWEGLGDYQAARNVLVSAISENPNDVLNAINLLKLSTFVGRADDVAIALGYLNAKRLKRRDALIVQSTLERLGSEGRSSTY